MNSLHILICLFNSLFASLSPAKPGHIEGYDLHAPDAKLVLPLVLHEISGITMIDSTSIACVQDEKGIVFFYDLPKNTIAKQYMFNIDGDYEEIVRVEQTLYILRSEGTLFEIENYSSKKFKVRSFYTGIPSDNNEGLCYDADKKRLLIACKGKAINGLAYKRAIYAFDLKTHRLSATPVFEFDMTDISEFAEKEKVPFPKKTNKKGEVSGLLIKFRPSAIAIHPIDHSLYLLSAADHCLFVFSSLGALQRIELLDPVLFNKSEGLTFFPNGDMLISNEGQDKKPTLLRFNYRH